MRATLADAAHAFTPCFATRLTHHARLSLHVASGGWHHCQPHVAAHCHLSTRGLRHSPASRFRSISPGTGFRSSSPTAPRSTKKLQGLLARAAKAEADLDLDVPSDRDLAV